MESSFCSGGSSSEEESREVMEELDANQYGTFVELLHLHRFHDFLAIQLKSVGKNSSITTIRLGLAQLNHEIVAAQEQRYNREDLAYNADADEAYRMIARLRGLSARIQSHRQIQDRRRMKRAAKRSQTDDQLPCLSPEHATSTTPHLQPEQRLPTPLAALLSLPDTQNIHAPREVVAVEDRPMTPREEEDLQTTTPRERDCSGPDVGEPTDHSSHDFTQRSSELSLEKLRAELDECHMKLFVPSTSPDNGIAKLKETHQQLEVCQAEIIRHGDLGEVSPRTVELAKEVCDISRSRIIETNEADQDFRRATAHLSSLAPEDGRKDSKSKSMSKSDPCLKSRYRTLRPLPPLPPTLIRMTSRKARDIVAKSSRPGRKPRKKTLVIFQNTPYADLGDGKANSAEDSRNDSGIGEDLENEWSSCSENESQQDKEQVVQKAFTSATEMGPEVKDPLGYRFAEDYDADSESHEISEEDITICLGDDSFDESVSEFTSDSDASTVREFYTPSSASPGISKGSMSEHKAAAATRRWRYYEPLAAQDMMSEESGGQHETPGRTKHYSLASWVSRLHDESSLRCLDGLHSTFYDEILAQPRYHRVWKRHEESMLQLACQTYIPNDIHHQSPNSFDLLSLHGDETLLDYEICPEDTTHCGDYSIHDGQSTAASNAIRIGCIRGGTPCPDELSSPMTPMKLEFLDRFINQTLYEIDRDRNGETPELRKPPPNTARSWLPSFGDLTTDAAVREAEQASSTLLDKHLEIARRQAAAQPVYIANKEMPAEETANPSSSQKRKKKKTTNLQEESQSSSDEAYIESDADSEEFLIWIAKFVNSRGNEYFCDVDEEYLTDRFNLTSLNTEVQYYQYALDLVTDMLEIECEDEMRETIEKSARHLYGLVHARYIVTTRGLQKMCEKYKAGDFGKCPRVACDGTHLLPMGQNDTANISPVKLYCAKCEDLYNPKSSRHATIDGAYFGTSFHSIFFQVYPNMMPAKSLKRYEPRVFGFKMHASATLARWQAESAAALRERVKREGLETGFEAEERERDGEGSEIDEQDGIDDMFEAGNARIPQVLR